MCEGLKLHNVHNFMGAFIDGRPRQIRSYVENRWLGKRVDEYAWCGAGPEVGRRASFAVFVAIRQEPAHRAGLGQGCERQVRKGSFMLKLHKMHNGSRIFFDVKPMDVMTCVELSGPDEKSRICMHRKP